MKQSKKPARWEFLNELDGRPTDTTPIRAHGRKPYKWEILLYAAGGMMWLAAIVIAVTGKYGAAGLTVLGGSFLCLGWAIFELMRQKRCKGVLLGTVESFTRRRHVRKNAKYPVIRFEVNGTVYTAHRATPAHPSTLGNEEWVRYNPQDPTDNYVASDSDPKLSIGLTVLTAFLGVVLLILELN